MSPSRMPMMLSLMRNGTWLYALAACVFCFGCITNDRVFTRTALVYGRNVWDEAEYLVFVEDGLFLRLWDGRGTFVVDVGYWVRPDKGDHRIVVVSTNWYPAFETDIGTISVGSRSGALRLDAVRRNLDEHLSAIPVEMTMNAEALDQMFRWQFDTAHGTDVDIPLLSPRDTRQQYRKNELQALSASIEQYLQTHRDGIGRNTLTISACGDRVCIHNGQTAWRQCDEQTARRIEDFTKDFVGKARTGTPE